MKLLPSYEKAFIFLSNLLALFLILTINFYQYFIHQQSLLSTFDSFQKFTKKSQIILAFFDLNFNSQEKIPDLVVKILKKYQLPLLTKGILFNFLSQETLENFFYSSLKTGWQNLAISKIYLIIFSYNLFLKSNLVKISTYSLTEEVLEL